MNKINIKNKIESIAWKIYKGSEKFVYLTLKNDLIYTNSIVVANLRVITEDHKTSRAYLIGERL